jgi:post-segregation antitoxin (ccd killing protein)
VTAKAKSQLAELRNVLLLLEEARALSLNLSHHLRALLGSGIGEAPDGLDWQIEESRAAGG